jgi:hypothetical protein
LHQQRIVSREIGFAQRKTEQGFVSGIVTGGAQTLGVLAIFGLQAFLFARDRILEVKNSTTQEEPESLFHVSLSSA